uniref:Rad60/SUMO-like domain-containing protein n=1 Tax=Heliothis virescens TaxID=7102 RepID=A0A2A4JNZ8_HELVI
MSSSDSEDDCYGNIAQKLQSIKNNYVKERVESVVTTDTTEVAQSCSTLSKPEEIASVIVDEDLNSTVNSTDNDEYTLDAIIANNSKAKPKRGRGGKRKASSATCGSSKRTTRTSARAASSASQSTSNSNEGRTSPVSNTVEPEPFAAPEPQNTRRSSARGRRAARGRSARGRGRGWSPRGRGRAGRDEIREIFDVLFPRRQNTPYTSNSYPIYSVGNTDEYPDQCDSQALFSSNIKPAGNDVEIVETDPLEDDNEEMSVKVYWQNLEIFKFKIRKFQKLTQIFNYFTDKEGVSSDKLLFTYNDRILKIDDTPDSINYSIAKFIDGGIVNQDVRHLVAETNGNHELKGFKIKFQCQNKKKPFETSVDPNERLMSAMIKCAEYLETPLDKLKFYFDGDLINSKNTPQDLDLEGGECIDVKICS